MQIMGSYSNFQKSMFCHEIIEISLSLSLPTQVVLNWQTARKSKNNPGFPLIWLESSQQQKILEFHRISQKGQKALRNSKQLENLKITQVASHLLATENSRMLQTLHQGPIKYYVICFWGSLSMSPQLLELENFLR